MGELTGQAALVTGAAQGIGLGIALELVRAGADVVVADLDLTKAAAAVRHIRQETGHEAVAVTLDVTNDRSVREGVQAALERLSSLHVLVNNAGIHCEKTDQVSTVEHFTRCFEVNLFGVWRTSQALIPHFKARGGGRIVNIASINGRKPWAETPAYSASKAAVINLTQSMAMTLGADNINVNAVCPGGVLTPMADAFTRDREALQQEMIRPRALKRPLLAEDIAHAVVFLASPRSRNITGQALNVDGGAVMS
jgi:NAD(P)-dependent dehydrogenase (short-subunit alcohol dehydrogenase family)